MSTDCKRCKRVECPNSGKESTGLVDCPDYDPVIELENLRMVCMACGKVYREATAEPARDSHGICPGCQEKDPETPEEFARSVTGVSSGPPSGMSDFERTMKDQEEVLAQRALVDSLDRRFIAAQSAFLKTQPALKEWFFSMARECAGPLELTVALAMSCRVALASMEKQGSHKSHQIFLGAFQAIKLAEDLFGVPALAEGLFYKDGTGSVN